MTSRSQAFLDISFCIALTTIASFCYVSIALADDKSIHHNLGVASCASSNCHGSALPINNSKVLQNEFVTWFRHDAHARAYQVLTNDQSKKMTMHLGLGPAEKEPRCLICHATYSPTAKNDGKFRIEDGVGCESCHGASEGWLAPHVVADASHERNVSLGMTDLSTDRSKAAVCLDCHLGSNRGYVDHALYGAGHPRLTFELDTFLAIEPPHWAHTLKGEKIYSGDPTRSWMVGQLFQAIRRLELLLSPHGKAGLFPELSTMHCFTCHHSLSGKQFSKRNYDGVPGGLRLNLSETIVVAKILSVLSPSDSIDVMQRIGELQKEYGQFDTTPLITGLIVKLQKVIPIIEQQTLSDKTRQKLFYGLTKTGDAVMQYETAEQVAMGASAIAASLPHDLMLKEKVKGLYRNAREPDDFSPR